MKLIVAKTAGFCMGVRRAVEMVLDAPGKYKNPIYTFGPLIHNPSVLNLLKERGISVIEDIPEKGSGTILIRAHGVPSKVKTDLNKAGFNVIDATCPRVIKVQTIIKKHAEKKYAVIIIGDKNHPEVTGLLSYAGEKGNVVESIEEFNSLKVYDRGIIVAQTTQSTMFFEMVKKRALVKCPHYKIFNTICDSTAKRQEEVTRIAESVDAVVVVGGRNSGNTRRLAEIAAKTGKFACHIETEDELDLNKLSSARSIGITAGASTPNWIIKRVYRTLEMLPMKRGQKLRSLFLKIQRSLLLTNIYVAIGAGCLCYASIKLQGLENNFFLLLVSALYVLSMHIFNNLTGVHAGHYNDPDRESFYIKNRFFLGFLAAVAGSVCLFSAYFVGTTPFIIILAMSFTGIIYNLKLIPEKLTKGKHLGVRDIPGSKTVLVALALGIITVLFPVLSVSGSIDPGTMTVFIWSTCLVFVRTAFFDILDMQGDRLVGKETIPILLGEKRTLKILKILLAAIFLSMVLATRLHFIPSLGYLLSLCPFLLFWILAAHEKEYIVPGIRLDFLIETHFLLAGILTLLWSVLNYT